jgi:Domain of unknown function (DUF1874).
MSQQRLYVANAFSLSMLSKESYLMVKEVDIETVKAMLTQPFISAVGHESTAKLLTALLGVEVPYNRIQVRLQKGDRLLVFQLLTRLEEGRVLDEDELRRLPHKFYIVEVVG